MFCHNEIAQFCIKHLKNIDADLTGNSFLCAVCYNGSLDLFNELNNEDLKTYLAEKWHDLSPIDISSSFRNDELLKKPFI